MKSMKESGYIDGYTDESTGNIGIEIYGRDAVLLNAPEVRLSPDTPLLTKAQDVAGAINELFQLDPGGGDDWTPPENWLPVPEPEDYEICLLVDIINVANDNYSTLKITLARPEDAYIGYGPITVDWGDGTVKTWLGYENGDSWSAIGHTYESIGQYVVKITTSYQSCFLEQIWPQGNYSNVLIAKLGAEIIVNNDSVDKSGWVSEQDAFYSHYRLHYVKLNGKGGLQRENMFYRCYSLRKIDITVPPTIIPSQTFLGCYNLTKFDFSEVVEIASSGLNNSGFSKIDLPKCTLIGDRGINNCYRLSEINAPVCQAVGNYGLNYNCSLEKAVFAENCTFGTNCFTGCYNLYPRPDGSTT